MIYYNILFYFVPKNLFTWKKNSSEKELDVTTPFVALRTSEGVDGLIGMLVKKIWPLPLPKYYPNNFTEGLKKTTKAITQHNWFGGQN
jgi:hypothetical protein